MNLFVNDLSMEDAQWLFKTYQRITSDALKASLSVLNKAAEEVDELTSFQIQKMIRDALKKREKFRKDLVKILVSGMTLDEICDERGSLLNTASQSLFGPVNCINRKLWKICTHWILSTEQPTLGKRDYLENCSLHEGFRSGPSKLNPGTPSFEQSSILKSQIPNWCLALENLCLDMEE